ncbi:MAG: cell division ATP-binding protein FtsE [Nitrospirota bacterium]
MIQMYHVTKYYNEEVSALRDINLRVEKGELVFLTGPSGAGKTTLLKLIYCAERPEEGQIFVAGWDVAKLRRRSIPYLRRNIGVVFQDFKLLQKKTVFENIAFALRVMGTSHKEIKRRVPQVLKLVGLSHKMDSFPQHLSGGEQQKLVIARAVVNEPAVLLADEPTGNLDVERSLEIINLFREINIRGTTVLIATHNQGLIQQFKSRVITLNKGCITEDNPAIYTAQYS